MRQLESMFRLSESFVKINCSEEVTAKHVKEAYRLLNKVGDESCCAMVTENTFLGLTSLMRIWIMVMFLRERLMKKHPWRLTMHLNLLRQYRNQ